MTFVPTEEQMRSQMFLTMQAAEGAFKSISAYLGGRSVGETIARAVDQDDASGAYAALQVICKECDGIAVFKDYERRYHDPEDTCKCSHITLDEFNVSSEVAAIYRSVHADRAAKRHCYCGKPGNPGPHMMGGPCGCPSCHGEIEDADCICPEKVFTGSVRIKGDLIVENTLSTVDAMAVNDIDNVRSEIVAIKKALGIIGSFAQFNDPPAFGMKPSKQIHYLVGQQSCNCVGTGWAARDEQCKDCRGRGYREA
jgi:hypothetical protein